MARIIKSFSLTPANVAFIEANAVRGKLSDFLNRALDELRKRTATIPRSKSEDTEEVHGG